MALGLLMMKSRSAHLPMAAGANTIGAIVAWIRDPMWIGGLGVQTAGWALYVIAVSRAPVSMVAVMMQGGIALFVIASVVILGERASPREWVGIGAIVFGMLMLTLSLNGGETEGAFEPATLLIFTALLTLAGLAPMAVARLNASGAAAAILSGVAFGLGGIVHQGDDGRVHRRRRRLARASNRLESLRVRHDRRQHRRDCLAAELVSFGARDNRDAAVGSAVEHRADRRRDDRVRRTIAGRIRWRPRCELAHSR